MNNRRIIIYALLSFFLLLFIYKIVWLQFQTVNNNQTLKDKGIKQGLGIVKIQGYRGKILDTNGHLLAVELPLKDIILDPVLLQKELYSKLAKALNISLYKLKNKIKHTNSARYLPIIKNLPQTSKIIRNIQKLKKKVWTINNKRQLIHGVFLEYSAKRYYPEGATLSPLLGLTNHQLVGIDGLEKIFEKRLASQNGEKQVVFDATRKEPINIVKVIKPAVQGKDLQLTINKNIQYYTFSTLRNAVKKHKANAGSAIVLDNNGNVLALANYPSDNPNNRKKYNPSGYRNRAVLDVFDIGSTIKPIIISIALDNKVIKPDDIIQTIDKKGRKISLTISQVLEKSHNPSMIEISKKLSKYQIWKTLNDLGFGYQTTLLPQIENNGKLRYYTNWYEKDKESIAYGYGMNATLAQLAQAYLVFANHGAKININLFKENTNKQKQQIFSEKTIIAVKKMLQSVVKIGTGKRAKLKNISVLGKTGTARKFIDGKYHNDKHRAFFVGLVPADKPKYIMAIMIDEPKIRGYGGGSVAAPVFKRTMDNIFKYAQ
ncbi:Cell division protein FtsI [Peptidoglycan synthetase] [hydrothermal vent metagenome]|uniref:Cell division protein FtsI [Peptidoglycan synthetase] n=1 Tax=hydrothermal vent metagenome TaxID=652676 RepID=A0A1W1CH58_9ZZZZ